MTSFFEFPLVHTDVCELSESVLFEFEDVANEGFLLVGKELELLLFFGGVVGTVTEIGSFRRGREVFEDTIDG